MGAMPIPNALSNKGACSAFRGFADYSEGLQRRDYPKP